MFLSVVMPVYNEEGSIASVVVEHLRLLEKLGSRLSEWEVVCVDDASRDRSSKILENLSREEPRLRVVRNETNLGIYGAFMRCYREARGDYIYSTGSDGQWPAENLALMLDPLQAGADLVVGVRINRNEVYSIPRRVISYLFNRLPQVLFGVVLHDAGSVKIGRRAIFQFELISQSPFSEAERLIKAMRSGYQVVFLPIRFTPRLGGKARGDRWSNVGASVWDMFRCVAKYGMRHKPQSDRNAG